MIPTNVDDTAVAGAQAQASQGPGYQDYDGFRQEYQQRIDQAGGAIPEEEFEQLTRKYNLPYWRGWQDRFFEGGFDKKTGFVEGITDLGMKALPFLGGWAEVAPAYEAYQTGKRVEEGTATDEDIDYLMNFMLDAQQPQSFWYGAGQLLGTMPAYGVEFAAGGAGVARLAGTKVAGKALRETVEAGLEKHAEKSVARKFLGELAGRTVLTGAASGRVPAAGYQEAFNNMGLVLTQDEARDLHFFMQGEIADNLEILGLGMSSYAIEMASEMSGARLSTELWKKAGYVGKKIPGVGDLHKSMEMAFTKVFQKAARVMGTDKAMDVLKKAGWNGLAAEYMEEVEGQLVRDLLPWHEDGVQLRNPFPSVEESLQILMASAIYGTGVSQLSRAAGRTNESYAEQAAKAKPGDVIDLTPPQEPAEQPAGPPPGTEDLVGERPQEQFRRYDKERQAEQPEEDAPAEVAPPTLDERQKAVDALKDKPVLFANKADAQKAAKRLAGEMTNYSHRIDRDNADDPKSPYTLTFFAPDDTEYPVTYGVMEEAFRGFNADDETRKYMEQAEQPTEVAEEVPQPELSDKEKALERIKKITPETAKQRKAQAPRVTKEDLEGTDRLVYDALDAAVGDSGKTVSVADLRAALNKTEAGKAWLKEFKPQSQSRKIRAALDRMQRNQLVDKQVPELEEGKKRRRPTRYGRAALQAAPQEGPIVEGMVTGEPRLEASSIREGVPVPPDPTAAGRAFDMAQYDAEFREAVRSDRPIPRPTRPEVTEVSYDRIPVPQESIDLLDPEPGALEFYGIEERDGELSATPQQLRNFIDDYLEQARDDSGRETGQFFELTDEKANAIKSLAAALPSRQDEAFQRIDRSVEDLADAMAYRVLRARGEIEGPLPEPIGLRAEVVVPESLVRRAFKADQGQPLERSMTDLVIPAMEHALGRDVSFVEVRGPNMVFAPDSRRWQDFYRGGFRDVLNQAAEEAVFYAPGAVAPDFDAVEELVQEVVLQTAPARAYELIDDIRYRDIRELQGIATANAQGVEAIDVSGLEQRRVDGDLTAYDWLEAIASGFEIYASEDRDRLYMITKSDPAGRLGFDEDVEWTASRPTPEEIPDGYSVYRVERPDWVPDKVTHDLFDTVLYSSRNYTYVAPPANPPGTLAADKLLRLSGIRPYYVTEGAKTNYAGFAMGAGSVWIDTRQSRDVASTVTHEGWHEISNRLPLEEYEAFMAEVERVAPDFMRKMKRSYLQFAQAKMGRRIFDAWQIGKPRARYRFEEGMANMAGWVGPQVIQHVMNNLDSPAYQDLLAGRPAQPNGILERMLDWIRSVIKRIPILRDSGLVNLSSRQERELRRIAAELDAVRGEEASDMVSPSFAGSDMLVARAQEESQGVTEGYRSDRDLFAGEDVASVEQRVKAALLIGQAWKSGIEVLRQTGRIEALRSRRENVRRAQTVGAPIVSMYSDGQGTQLDQSVITEPPGMMVEAMPAGPERGGRNQSDVERLREILDRAYDEYAMQQRPRVGVSTEPGVNELAQAADVMREEEGLPEPESIADYVRRAEEAIRVKGLDQAVQDIRNKIENSPSDQPLDLVDTLVLQRADGRAFGDAISQPDDAERDRMLAEALDIHDMLRDARAWHGRNLAMVKHIGPQTPQQQLWSIANQQSYKVQVKLASIKASRKKALREGKYDKAKKLGSRRKQILEQERQKAIDIINELRVNGFRPESMTEENLLDAYYLRQIGEIVTKHKADFTDHYVSYRLAAMLSWVGTHDRNLVGNFMHLGTEQVLMRSVNRLLGAVSPKLAARPGAVVRGELGSFLQGVMHEIPAIMEAIATSYKTGLSTYELTLQRRGFKDIAGIGDKVESQLVRTFPSKKLAWLDWLSFRALTAMDAGFKMLSFAGEYHALSHRAAMNEGLEGDALVRRANEIRNDPNHQVWAEAHTTAMGSVFQSPAGGAQSVVEYVRREIDARTGLPLAVSVVPFIGAPMQIAIAGGKRIPPVKAFMMGYSAWNGARGAVERRNYQTDPDLLIKDLGDFTVGLATTWLVWKMVENGLDGVDEDEWAITGSPQEFGSRRDLEISGGNPPNSIHIPYVGWRDISGIEPLSTMLIPITDFCMGFMKANEKGDKPGLQTASTNLVRSAQTLVKNKTFMRGISDLVSLFDTRQGPISILRKMAFEPLVPNVVRGSLRESNEHVIQTNFKDTFDSSVWEKLGQLKHWNRMFLPSEAAPWSGIPVYHWSGEPVKRGVGATKHFMNGEIIEMLADLTINQMLPPGDQRQRTLADIYLKKWNDAVVNSEVPEEIWSIVGDSGTYFPNVRRVDKDYTEKEIQWIIKNAGPEAMRRVQGIPIDLKTLNPYTVKAIKNAIQKPYERYSKMVRDTPKEQRLEIFRQQQ